MSSSTVIVLTIWSMGPVESGADVAAAGTVAASSIPAASEVATPTLAPTGFLDNVPPGGSSSSTARTVPRDNSFLNTVGGGNCCQSPYARAWRASPPGLDQGPWSAGGVNSTVGSVNKRLGPRPTRGLAREELSPARRAALDALIDLGG